MPYVVQKSESMRTAMLKITSNKSRAVIVLNGTRVVGVVSDGDIRRAFLKDVLSIAPVERIMNMNCVTTVETNIKRVAEIARHEKITLLPMVDSKNMLRDIFIATEPVFRGGVCKPAKKAIKKKKSKK